MNPLFLGLGHTVADAVLPEKRVPELALALKLRRLFAAYQINTVIDVGANRGQYRDFLRYRVGFKGKIESFEPLPDLAQGLLTKAKDDNQWSIHPCALGARVGKADINVMQETMFSSFLTPRPVGNTRLDNKNTVVNMISVPVRPLDEVFEGKGDFQKTYLKLDTQGFDLEVLEGGVRTIASVRALQTELSFKPFYEDMPHYSESLKMFEKHGFSVCDLFLVTADGAQHAMEFDCILTR